MIWNNKNQAINPKAGRDKTNKKANEQMGKIQRNKW